MLKITGVELSNRRMLADLRITAKVQYGDMSYQSFDIELTKERTGIIMDAVRAMVAEQLGMVELEKPEPEIVEAPAPPAPVDADPDAPPIYCMERTLHTAKSCDCVPF
jgi:hypothetical protein